MNKEKFGWGLVLLFVGGILLLDNLSIIDFYWRSVLHMWPVILIVVGVNLLVPKRGAGSLISIVVTVVALAFLAYRGTIPPNGRQWFSEERRGWDSERRERNERRRERNEGRRERSSGTFTHDYDSAITEAHLDIRGGAVAYEITGHTERLFNAEATNTFGAHHLETTTTGNVARLLFSMKNDGDGRWDLDADDNQAQISLNTRPEWHINLEMGAGSAEFDLTEYKVASLRFKGGAASFEARLGMPLAETVISAESGVADIEVEIPRAAACRIVIDSGLSSKDFPGFTKQNDGSYTTENYTGTANHFIINLKGGLSSFSVQRYD
ncbi:LiaI-LiaF-like domain-containing protein [Parapedobacter lycopersici]|uniref:LiaI-LiaF-like domain-containing protein n=1 Tax=Parapedobacter lycopersici TaxID=1864939 RepID=UPI00214D9574|nr:DUF5668 domain-containing protein [Parapedobacter lycopersici]